MAVTNPKKSNLTAYDGNTFDFLYTFEDSNGSAIDLDADYNDIEFRIFKYNSSTNEVSLTVSGGDLSIANTNELTGTVTASQTSDLASDVLYYEIAFTLSDGSVEVYLFGRFFIETPTSASGEAEADFTITVNQNTNEITFSESYDAAAKATQAKVDAETAESNAQTSASNAATSETNAANSASAASTSETNAANSASDAADDADDAEKQAQNTTSFTDSNGATFDKGAKGYANDAETSAQNAEADAEQEVVEAHGYYSKELSNIKERLRTLENA